VDGLRWFRDGLAGGDLLIHCCRQCGTFAEPRAVTCPACGSVELDAVAASGRARVISATRTRARGEDAGRTFVIAQLEEGPWWWGEVVDAEAPPVGVELALEIGREADGEPLPRFRLHPTTDSNRETDR
jgi:uncharacterized OB-fold protein